MVSIALSARGEEKVFLNLNLGELLALLETSRCLILEGYHEHVAGRVGPF
jgi:hypothetical protein